MNKYEISIDRTQYEPECESVEMTGEKVLMAWYRDGGALISVGLDSKYYDAFDEPTFDRAEAFAKHVYKRVVKMVDEVATAELEVLRTGK